MRAPRVSYANVTATLALFVALGGASYAAVELPHDSVGSAQLRRGSVTPSRLGFTVTSRAVTSDRVVTLGRPGGAQCQDVIPPPTPPPTCAAPAAVRLVKTVIALAHPANLLVLANANLVNVSQPPAAVQVQLFARVDGPHGTELPGQASFAVAPSSEQRGFYQGVSARAPAGRHSIEVFATNVAANVTADDISLYALALPNS